MPMHRVEGGRCSCQRGAECATAGKHPVRSWKTDPESRPTTDPDKIAQWWSALGHLGAEVPEGWLERVPTRAIEGTSSGGVAL